MISKDSLRVQEPALAVCRPPPSLAPLASEFAALVPSPPGCPRCIPSGSSHLSSTSKSCSPPFAKQGLGAHWSISASQRGPDINWGELGGGMGIRTLHPGLRTLTPTAQTPYLEGTDLLGSQRPTKAVPSVRKSTWGQGLQQIPCEDPVV